MPTSMTYSTLDDPSSSGSLDSNNVDLGFIYYLGVPLTGSGITAISATTGNIVGDFPSGSIPHGFISDGSNFTTLNNPLGVNGTVALSVNDAGNVVGVYVDSVGKVQSFLYSNNNYTTLSDPSGIGGTFATGINNAGIIVGSYNDSTGNTHGFVYNNGTYTTIDDPLNVFGSGAVAINGSGQIVGGYADGNGLLHGYLYNNGTYTTIDDPLGVNGTVATGINDHGQIVGIYLDGSMNVHGFLYSNGTYTTIDDPLGVGGVHNFFVPTLKGSAAVSIDDAGQIVGAYTDSSGTMHGFVTNAMDVIASAPTSVQQEILGLYAALYNRAAEFPGYSFWVGVDASQPDSGGVTVANANSLAVTLNDATVLGQAFVNTQSTYFNQVYASLTDSQFINALYVNIGGNAGDPGGIAYWANLLAQAEAGGQSSQASRAGLVGQFVHDLIDIDLSPGAAALGLTLAQYDAALQRQETINNKIAVSLAYSNASQQPGGTILDPHVVGDAAFQAAIAVLQPVSSDPTTVTAAITGINNAVAHQDLSLI